jgi:hypothetical protein
VRDEEIVRGLIDVLDQHSRGGHRQLVRSLSVPERTGDPPPPISIMKSLSSQGGHSSSVAATCELWGSADGSGVGSDGEFDGGMTRLPESLSERRDGRRPQPAAQHSSTQTTKRWNQQAQVVQTPASMSLRRRMSMAWQHFAPTGLLG